jgi:hypothetical protein
MERMTKSMYVLKKPAGLGKVFLAGEYCHPTVAKG